MTWGYFIRDIYCVFVSELVNDIEQRSAGVQGMQMPIRGGKDTEAQLAKWFQHPTLAEDVRFRDGYVCCRSRRMGHHPAVQ